MTMKIFKFISSILDNQFTHIEDRVLKRFNAELENNEDIIAFTELDVSVTFVTK